MTKADKAKLILDFFHRTMMHHAIWFAEVQHQMGREKAFKALDTAWQRSYDIQMKRLGKILGFENEDGVPGPLLDLPDEKLDELRYVLAALGEPRHAQRHDVEAMIEVLAETAFRHLALEIAACGGNDADIHGDFGSAPEALEFLLDQNA